MYEDFYWYSVLHNRMITQFPFCYNRIFYLFFLQHHLMALKYHPQNDVAMDLQSNNLILKRVIIKYFVQKLSFLVEGTDFVLNLQLQPHLPWRLHQSTFVYLFMKMIFLLLLLFYVKRGKQIKSSLCFYSKYLHWNWNCIFLLHHHEYNYIGHLSCFSWWFVIS